MSAIDFNANIVIFVRYPIFPQFDFERPAKLHIIEYMIYVLLKNF